MALTASATDPFQKETTFTNYSQEQGEAYANIRRNYDPSVYQAVLDFHAKTGGKPDTLLDVGCGPGVATFSLAPHFSHTIALDPSEGMVSTARSMGGEAAKTIRFEVSSAEELGSNLNPPVVDSSVDLITAATAAHWFDMEGFWPSAARVLKPGGTVALWAGAGVRLYATTPNAEAIQAAMDANYEGELGPYITRGNLVARSRYRDLLLPWMLETPVEEFAEEDFVRREWEEGERFYPGPQEIDLGTWEKMYGTASAVTRWREAHPELVGTEQDVLRVMRRKIERLLHEAGVEKGKEMLRGSARGVLLMFKKRGGVKDGAA